MTTLVRNKCFETNSSSTHVITFDCNRVLVNPMYEKYKHTLQLKTRNFNERDVIGITSKAELLFNYMYFNAFLNGNEMAKDIDGVLQNEVFLAVSF